MNRPDRFLFGAPGSPTGQQSAGRFIELRFQKELRECRVSLVSTAVIQAYLCIAGQFQLAGPATVIDKRHHAHLGIDVRHDANGPPRFDVAVEMSEFSLVSVKRVFAFIAGLAQRLISNGPDLAGSQVTDVAELTPAIARQIFAPARDIQTSPHAGSGASSGDVDAVSTVRE